MFAPTPGSTNVAISASNASANSAVGICGTTTSGTWCVVNNTATIAYIKPSTTTGPTATSSDIPVGPLQTAYIPVNSTHAFVGVLLATAISGVVSVQTGYGEPGVNNT